MAPDSNWLSFSLSSMETILEYSSPALQPADDDSHHYYSFVDNFYGDSEAWPSQIKCQSTFAVATTAAATMRPPQSPKLEDFFACGGESVDTQDSSLTSNIYDSGAAYLVGHGDVEQGLHAIAEFQPTVFPANSGSEVDDSVAFAAAGGGQTQSPVESAAELVAPTSVDHSKAIVSADSEKCKKVNGDNFGQRTSIYRGVTRHRWTGRYEAHLWDNSCRREGQARKGRQVYLGGYDKEDKAARAYDLAALKYWGPSATTNFPVASYTKELEEMTHMTKQEFIASLRRKSSGFSRGASIYRGVTRHHQQGRWQARIGRVAGNKDLYLGTFATEEEAAEAYDIAAIKFRGTNAVTNFEMSRYDVEAIRKSALPIGGMGKRLKLSLDANDRLPRSPTFETPIPINSNSNRSFSVIHPTSAIPSGVPINVVGAPYYHHHHNVTALVAEAAPGLLTSEYLGWGPAVLTP